MRRHMYLFGMISIGLYLLSTASSASWQPEVLAEETNYIAFSCESGLSESSRHRQGMGDPESSERA